MKLKRRHAYDVREKRNKAKMENQHTYNWIPWKSKLNWEIKNYMYRGNKDSDKTNHSMWWRLEWGIERWVDIVSIREQSEKWSLGVGGE